MIRSAEPSKLTAGKIFVWSIESFGMVSVIEEYKN